MLRKDEPEQKSLVIVPVLPEPSAVITAPGYSGLNVIFPVLPDPQGSQLVVVVPLAFVPTKQ